MGVTATGTTGFCTRCGQALRVLFSVGTYCPNDCDKKQGPLAPAVDASDDFKDEETTKPLCPSCANSKITIVQAGSGAAPICECGDCGHRWWS